MSLSGLFESASGWVLMILGLGFLVFVHELGHFLLAKRVGVNVEVFSIGMGPFLLTATRRGTVYALSLIPFGGYVRMTGQTDLVVERKGPTRPDSYLAKTPGARAAILAAGAVMNILAAYVLFVLALAAGALFVPAEVGRFNPRDPLYAELANQGVRPGDRILAADGAPVERFQWDLGQLVATRGAEEGPITLQLERPDGRVYTARLQALHDPDLSFAILAIPEPTEEIAVRFGAEGVWGVLLRTSPEAPAGSPLRDLRFITAFEHAGESGAAGSAVPLDQKGRGAGELLAEALRRAGESDAALGLTFFDGSTASVRPCRIDRYRIGVGLEGLRVRFVQKGTPAERAGLAPGERLVEVDGERVANARELIGRVDATGGRPFELTLEPPPGEGGARPAARTVTLSAARHTEWVLGVPEDAFALGAELDEKLVVRKVAAGHAAERAGLEAGDRVLTVDGEPVRSRETLLRRVRESGGRVLTFGIEAARSRSRSTVLLRAQSWRPVHCAGAVMVRRVEPGSPGARAGLREGDVVRALVLRGGGRSARILWTRRTASGEGDRVETRSARVRLVETGPALRFEVEKRTTIRANPFTKAAQDLWFSIRTVGRILGGLFRGRVGTKAISGPLGIGMITVASTELGFGNFLWILAMISANLGVINLLPIPIFDGGHLAFLGYEKLRGRPAGPRVQELALYLGLAIILMLVALAMRNDISRFVFGP